MVHNQDSSIPDVVHIVRGGGAYLFGKYHYTVTTCHMYQLEHSCILLAMPSCTLIFLTIMADSHIHLPLSICQCGSISIFRSQILRYSILSSITKFSSRSHVINSPPSLSLYVRVVPYHCQYAPHLLQLMPLL